MSAIKVIPVSTPADFRAFIDLPWRIYQWDPIWVPPLKAEIAKLLNPQKHPFWRFAQGQLFLALKRAEVRGRLAAIVNHHHNRYHQEKMGAWGFFECFPDPEAAIALFAAGERWLKDQGMEFSRGPLNPSINYEVGLLIRGFDSTPALGFTYNPPYYLELVRNCGYKKEKDLFTFRITQEYQVPEWGLELSDRMAKKNEITIRLADPNNLSAELLLVNRIFNACWSNNWGFVPMTAEEITEAAQAMLPFLDYELLFFLCHRNEPVGVCLILPDLNPLLKRLNGRLGLSALFKKYFYKSEINGLRGYILGVLEQYRQLGLPLVALNYLNRVLRRKKQYQYLEMGWNLEDNHAINRVFLEGGLQPNRLYRIYRKDL